MLVRVLALVAVLQVASSADINRADVQPMAVVNIGGRNYAFSVLDGSISESITQCSDMGMNLAALETPEEILAVTNYIRDELSLATRMYWLSGMRVVNTWMWMSSGQYITVNNWDTGEPTETGYTNQACVFLYNAKFRDNNCNSNIHFICEQKDCP